MTKQEFRSGYCAIVGRPNAGKSTLLNRLTGIKLAITTHKPQTTRDRILGILHRDNAQVALVDTPGLHRPEGGMNQHMVRAAEAALGNADVVLWMAEVQKGDVRELSKGMHHIHALLEASGKPWVLGLNKTDKLRSPAEALPQIALWQSTFDPPCLVPMSAETGDNVDALVREIITRLPVGEPMFDSDSVTDRSERFLTAEIIREKAILETQEELPYSIAESIDEFDESMRFSETDPLVSIIATLHVERQGQKCIVVGKRGAVVRKIGMRARKDLRRLLECRVYLDLFVRVTPDWTRKQHQLKEFGYDN
jgi:GTP-binding protein Era